MKRISGILVLILLAASCSYLDPLDTKRIYSEESLDKNPSFVRGFLEKAFSNLPSNYNSASYVMLEGMTGDLLISSETDQYRLHSQGLSTIGNGIFGSFWTQDYSSILYLNKFLVNDLGYKTRYLTDRKYNDALCRNLKGDAFALRAWYEYDLLRKFAGKGTSGEMLGFPIMTDIVDYGNADPESFRRNTMEECVQQILADCDSALVYLPLANRDWLASETLYEGAIRWRRPDQITVYAIKSLVWLTWASASFNPGNDRSRWDKAAEYAAKVLDFKLGPEKEHGFNPSAAINIFNQQSPEAIWCLEESTTNLEQTMYPMGFNGNASYSPTQNIVDAFPMANGYPIDHPRSGYDPSRPYEGRDSRFYDDIFHNGSSVVRPSNSQVMYTFDTKDGGKDSRSGIRTSKTNYYLKKFLYQGWNRFDDKLESQTLPVMLIRFREMCLVFAEAANHSAGSARTKVHGYTAEEALRYVRQHPSDPYLEECSADEKKFDELVRNERRIELYLEGHRFYDLRRWGENLNFDVMYPEIKSVTDGVYDIEFKTAQTLKYPSLWSPLPRTDVRKAKLEQNQGWEDWK